MYRLTEKERKAANYFLNLKEYTPDQAGNAVKFACSICGCNREEQNYLLDWFFDGVASDLIVYGNKQNEFARLLDFCGDCWIINLDDPEYDEYRDVLYDGCMIAGEILPTLRLFVYNI